MDLRRSQCSRAKTPQFMTPSRIHESGRSAIPPSAPTPLKILVFAHKPPPHHGQSQMVQYLVDGFPRMEADSSAPGSSDPGRKLQLVHVDARLSDSLEDIGSLRSRKLSILLKHCWKAIQSRFRYGVRNFYYVPSPPKRASLYRDWIVMICCRPFFHCRKTTAYMSKTM